MAGVYANFANVTFSDYEFTITFARVDHEIEEGDVPGVVVSRVNMSTRFMKELVDAMQDAWSKWSTREGIRNLDRKSTRLNSSHRCISYAVFCLKKKKKKRRYVGSAQ